jgi:Domain of unknown function (DUF6378)
MSEKVMSLLSKREQEIYRERSNQYLDATFGNMRTGEMWSGILQNYFRCELPGIIPSHVVLLMLLAHKICRAAIPTPISHDHYDDMKVYVELAREAREKFTTDIDAKLAAETRVPTAAPQAERESEINGLHPRVCLCGHPLANHALSWSNHPAQCLTGECGCKKYREGHVPLEKEALDAARKP